MVAVDEAGHFCIPLLSGHVGGANELAERMAMLASGIPVITTATDINGIFAVDVFAARKGLCITDRKKAKELSAWLLDGGKVGFFCDSRVPQGAEGASGAGTTKTGVQAGGAERTLGMILRGICRHNICMNRVCRHNTYGLHSETVKGPPFLRTGKQVFLRLVPKVAVVGVGCRKGTPPDILEGCVLEALEEEALTRRR